MDGAVATGIMRRIGVARSVSSPSSTPPPIADVYEAHFRYVWRCLRGFGVAEPQLEDACQDVFVVVHRKLADFDGGARLTTWLYEIALRVARRYRSRAAREAQQQAPAEPDPSTSAAEAAPAAEHDLDCHVRLALAREALAALPDAKREVFVLACIEQRSAPEIARLTGIPTNTVYSRIRAAKQAFATELHRLQCRRTRRSHERPR